LKGLFFNAQESSFLNSYFNDENGLPQNSIIDISKDKQGFIWLAIESRCDQK
jgi:ligand-binding sensor domain-containing protein